MRERHGWFFEVEEGVSDVDVEEYSKGREP